MVNIIIPTYNESENIGKLINRLKATCDCSILVVDDSPDDKTALAANKVGGVVLCRSERGLSSAVIAGIEHSNSVDKLIIMDADFQHPPEVVPEIVKALETHDFVVASRYIKGGGCKNWSLKRRVISRAANLLARPLAPKTRDLASGFFGFHRAGLPKLSEVNDKGFKIMLELLVRGSWKSVIEVPYIFQTRTRGTTKMNSQQIKDYAAQLVELYIERFLEKFGGIKHE